MSEIDQVVDTIVNDLGMGGALKLHKIKLNWAETFPPPLSLHMEPVFLKDNILFINVDSNVWLQELYFNRATIISKLNKYGVKSIKLRLSVVKNPVKEEVKWKEERSLNADDRKFIYDVTKEIKDSTLKASINRVVEKSLKNRRT